MNNIINIDWKNYSHPIKAQITNNLGQILLEKNLSESKNSMDINFLASGFYHIQLIDINQQLTSKKFIKQ